MSKREDILIKLNKIEKKQKVLIQQLRQSDKNKKILNDELVRIENLFFKKTK